MTHPSLPLWLLLWCCVLAASPRLLAAQDDWSLTRERPAASKRRPPRVRGPSGRSAPASPTGRVSAETLIARLEARLALYPDESATLDRLRALWIERDGGLDPVIERYRARLAQAPEDAAGRGILGLLLASMGQNEAAATLLQEARTQRPASTRLAIAHARVLARLGRATEEGAAWAAALQTASHREDRMEALRALAALDIAAADWRAARERYAAMARLSGGGVFAQAGYARALADAGEHAAAAAEYARLAASRRGDARAAGPLWRDAARESMLAGDAAAAVGHARAALGLSAGDGALVREVYGLLVDAQRRLGTLEALAQELDRSRDTSLLVRAGALWDELGQPTRVEASYRRAVRLAPRSLQARLALAELLARTGQLDAAVQEYGRLVQTAPHRAELVVTLVELLARRGEVEKARALAREASESRPRDATLHRELAELYLRWEVPEAAVRELRQLTRIAPNDPSAWIALGTTLFETGDEAEAREAWAHLLELPGDAADRHATLARVLADHDQVGAALDALERARALRPEDVRLRREYASLLEREGRAGEAAEAWSRVLRSTDAGASGRREARQHLVALWKRNGSLGRHMVELEGRFNATPPDLEAGRTLAEAFARGSSGRLVDATRVLERLAELEPGNVETLRALERALAQVGQTERALEVLERLLELDPARADGYLRRGVELSLAAYMDDRALALARLAVQRAPERPESHELLGDLLRQRQDLPGAARAYRQALQLSSGRYDAAMALGEIELALGDTVAAHGAWLQALRGSVDEALVLRAGRALLQLHAGEGSLEALERALLPLAGSRRTTVHRRLLVDTYGAWLGPSARRVRRGTASEQDRRVLDGVGGRALTPLFEALLDPDPGQRDVALELLGALGRQNALGPLLAASERARSGEERARALLAAGMLADPTALPGFVALARGPSARLRAVGTWAVGRVEGAGARDALVSLLASPDAAVRGFAALGLGHLRASVATPSLVAALSSEADDDARASILWALAALDSSVSRDRLIADLGGPAPVAQAASVALAADPPALASAALVQSPEQRALSLSLLAGAPPGPVLKRLPVPDWPVSLPEYLVRVSERVNPARGAPGLERAVEPLSRAVSGALREGGAQAGRALDLLEGRDAGLSMGPLTRDLHTWPAGRCSAAVSALERFAAAVEPALAQLAAQRRPGSSARAAHLLARTGGGDALWALRAALQRDAGERARVLDAFAGPGVPVGLRQEVSALARGDDSWVVRLYALRSLRVPRDRGEAQAIATLLSQEAVALVRAEGVRLLARGQVHWVRAALEGALEDPEPIVADMARAALAGTLGEGRHSALVTAECIPPN